MQSMQVCVYWHRLYRTGVSILIRCGCRLLF
uniref:Uncharacterized protein n=1 Tax=Anguilla anguilla TaxID=7936 RepID=A0A0E9PQA6_ANGAN